MPNNLSGFPSCTNWSNKGCCFTYCFTPPFLYNANTINKQNSPWKSSFSLLVTAAVQYLLSKDLCVFSINYLPSLNALQKTCFVKTILLNE